LIHRKSGLLIVVCLKSGLTLFKIWLFNCNGLWSVMYMRCVN